MAGEVAEAGGSVVAEDPAEHPPVDHPGRIRAEASREAAQVHGGPTPGPRPQQGPSPQQQKPGSARQGGQDGAKPGGGDSQDPAAGLKAVARPVAGLLTDVGMGPSPQVLRWLADNPAVGDNPFAPINIDDPTLTWQRTVLVGRRWREFVNPGSVQSSVHDILNGHTVQAEIARLMIGAPDNPDAQWAWREAFPQLAVAVADGNPVTAALDLAGQAPEDPRKALAAAWAGLPWGDYAHVAQLLAQHPDQVSLPLLGSMYWKQLTAALTVGSLLPDGSWLGRAARYGLGDGRMAMAIRLPGGKYVEDAVKASRRLHTDPDVPPPDKLEDLARSIQALEPTVVRKARSAAQAAKAAPPAAVEAPLVDLSSHLEQIREELAGQGPSQDRAAKLLQRLELLNITDPAVKKAGAEFQALRRADFTTTADFAAARQQRWDGLLEAVGKADASKVKQPAALDFLGALDLATLPTQTMRELMDLSHEQSAARGAQEQAANQFAKQQRQSMRKLFTGLFGREVLRDLESKKVQLTPELAQQQLPHMLPKMTAAQQAFLRATWNKFADYDLRRLHPEDVTPRPLHEYLGEVSAAAKPHAAQFIGSTHGILAFIQGGPHFLDDDPIDALTQSLLSRNRAQEAMLGEFFFPQMAALAEHGKVDMVEAMRALRDDAAFDRLSPEGKLIVDSWRQIQLLLRDRGMATGFRSDFVGRFDPRVPVRPVEDPKAASAVGKAGPTDVPDPEADVIPREHGTGSSVIGGTSKAHRQEAFVVDPADPHRVALSEKHASVFDLNAAMESARQDHVAKLVAQGKSDVEAAIEARRRYPEYHTNLAFAAYEYLGRELRALNAHQAVQSLLHAWTDDGQRLAYEGAEQRLAPADYRPLEKASRSYQNVRFHPRFAKLIDEANRSISPLDQGSLRVLSKLGSGAKSLIMFSPMVHAANVAGRVLPMLLTHPWAAFDELTGASRPLQKGLDAQTRRVYRVMEAMQNGVVPHKAARDFFNNTMTALGNATGDSRMFEVPAGAEAGDASKFIKDRARELPGLVGRITPGRLRDLNDWFWRSVFGFQVLAYHVEQRALAKRFPDMDPARVNMYAAFRANRWGGAIEPENWSQWTYQLSRTFMFAPNWLRSFLELQTPMYLRGELQASEDLRKYVREQWRLTVPAMLAGQHIWGNALNLLFSGHTIYQNQPQNRNRIEINPSNPYSPGRMVYDALKVADPAAVPDIDMSTGLNARTGAPLTWENPFARQETQLEEAIGAPSSPVTSGDLPAPRAELTFGASHLSPLVGALAAAANIDLYDTLRSGSMQWIDPGGWNPMDLVHAIAQLTPAGFAIPSQDRAAPLQQTQPGQQQTWQDEYRAWAQGLPLPLGVRDLVASLPESSFKAVISNVLGVTTPYEKAETTQGTRLDSIQNAQLKQLQDQHHKVMASKSADLLSGKMTPYQWRQWYQQYSPNYDGQLQAYYKGTATYVNGPAGLYAQWQDLYNQAALPDGSGVDWSKLEQLQADFTGQHTDDEMTSIKAYQAQQEHDYPALQMYREVTDNHRQQQQVWARQMGMTPSQLNKMLKDYGDVVGDRAATARFNAAHPQMQTYTRLNKNWEINNPYGQMYSLYYHSSAMRQWLAMSGETEQQGAQQLEHEWHQ